MKIGYIKIEKIIKTDNVIYNIFRTLIYKLHCITNKVSQDKYNKNIFYINNFSQESKEKMVELLSKNGISYVIIEDKKSVGYPQVDSNLIIKYMLPELIDYCYNKATLSNKEVYLLVNEYNEENIAIVTELANKVKVLNIVTENKLYHNLEKTLEENDIYVTVSSNKRKALKKAELCINIDFRTIGNYTINNDMIIIDTKLDNIKLPKFFNGIVIRGFNIDTKKVMPKFNDFEYFDKQSIIIASILELDTYREIRRIIENSKINIINVKNKRVINEKEFERISTGVTI